MIRRTLEGGMADITGIYEFNGRPGYQSIRIDAVNAGQLDASLIDDQNNESNIQGTYNDVTNQIVFNDASFPGEILFTNFFTGSAIFIPGTTDAFALAGTWWEQRLKIEGHHIIGLERDTGSWWADCRQDIIK
jgi:hypothetical protein